MPTDSSEKIEFVGQATYRCTEDPTVVYSTVLGSCVAACLHDPISRVGGMNHFLLPDGAGGGGSNDRYGVNLMERLINDMLKLGAYKKHIIAKVFGGAHVAVQGSTVGDRNGVFIREFLEREQIECVAASLGGDRARRIRFWPESGKASQMLLHPTDVRTELATPIVPAPPPVDDDEPEIWG